MNDKIDFLKKILGDCKRLETSKCQYKTSYIIIENKEFYICDCEHKEPVEIVGKHQYHQLDVVNKSDSQICMIKTDNCLFADDHKKCDCILFNKSKFYFVELSDSKNRSRKRRSATMQLAETIKIFKNNGFDFSPYLTRAVICFRSRETYPTQASGNTNRARFLEEFNIDLEEGNKIEFQ